MLTHTPPKHTHFISAILKDLIKIFNINYDYHIPGTAPQFGKIKRVNQTFKKHIAGLPWAKRLLIVLFSSKIAPRRDMGHESIVCFPEIHFSGFTEFVTTEIKDQYWVSPPLGFLSCYCPIHTDCSTHLLSHTLQPEDQILIKIWKEIKLEITWEGPFQMLLAI